MPKSYRLSTVLPKSRWQTTKTVPEWYGLAVPLIDQLAAIAVEQRGFVTPADAEGAGVNPVELRKMAARGRLERVAHGVYRIKAFPHRPNDELMVAVLWTGKRGAIAGQTALGLHDLCDVNPRRIDLVVPIEYRPRKAGSEQYRIIHARLGARDVELVEDIPVVVPSVAIEQAIAAHIDPRLIEQAIANGRRFGHLDVDDEERLRELQARELLRPAKRRARA